MKTNTISSEDFGLQVSRHPAMDSLLENVFDNLRGTRIFITGGTGWFGQTLLRALTHANDHIDLQAKITVLTRSPKRFEQTAPDLAVRADIALLQGDIRTFKFPKQSFSHLIHAAATSAEETFNGASATSKFDMLVDGTRHLTEFARYAEASHLLFTSSGAACHPSTNGELIREDSLLAPPTDDPSSAWGQGKRAAEFLCTLAGVENGINTTIARCFSFAGPGIPLNLHYAFGNFINAILTNKPIGIKGDGSPIRSYLNTGDLVIWLLTMLVRDGTPKIYNVGSDEPVSILELAHMMKKITNSKSKIIIAGDKEYSSGINIRNIYVPDITLARHDLKLNNWTSLENTIKTCLPSHLPPSS